MQAGAWTERSSQNLRTCSISKLNVEYACGGAGVDDRRGIRQSTRQGSVARGPSWEIPSSAKKVAPPYHNTKSRPPRPESPPVADSLYRRQNEQGDTRPRIRVEQREPGKVVRGYPEKGTVYGITADNSESHSGCGNQAALNVTIPRGEECNDSGSTHGRWRPS